MSRRWKPGDVALINGEFCLRTQRGWLFASRSGAMWSHHAGTNGDHVTSFARPLVTIDPEDREQVERLTGLLAIHGANSNDKNYWRETQAALRSLVTDPKPEEPTDPIIRVAADGLIWARVADVWVTNRPEPAEWSWLCTRDDFRILLEGDLA